MSKYVVLFLSFLASCSPYCDYNYKLQNAQEFVLDSYKIKEGKFAILELEGKRSRPLCKQLLLEYEDEIDEDDKLEITCLQSDKKQSAAADFSKQIAFHVINGEIKVPSLPPVYVKGLTLKEAEKKIGALYQKESSSTHVFIKNLEKRNSIAQLTGQVAISTIPVNGHTRLYEVLSKAQISSNANLFASYVLRDQKALCVDLFKLIHEGDMSQNIVMRAKDKIFIADGSAASVTLKNGEGHLQNIPVPKGYISVNLALSQAGDLLPIKNNATLLVIRNTMSCPKIYKLSGNHLTYLPDDSLLLMAGDTIIIKDRALIPWNRIINKLR